MKSGIYAILINNKRYIGSAVNICDRLRTHKSNLKLNKHINKYIQHAYNKYWDFDCYVLEYCKKENLLKREQFWINYFQAYDKNFGYNLRKEASSNLGIKKPHSEETKIKISLTTKGRKLSSETKTKMAIAQKGHACSQEVKDKIGKANRNLNKWPHALGSKCKCRECLDKNNLIRSKHLELFKNQIFLEKDFVNEKEIIEQNQESDEGIR